MGNAFGELKRQRLEIVSDLKGKEKNLTYSQACDLNAVQLPEHPAIIDRKVRMTWRELKMISDRIALSLLELGFMRPDIALIHLSNSAEQVLIRLACEKAGLRVILTNSAFRETELFSIIDRVGPRLGFISSQRAGDGHYDRLIQNLANAKIKLEFITVGGEQNVSWAKKFGSLASSKPPKISEHFLNHTRFGWGERFYFTTTSGSTSAPKIADTIYGHRIWLSLQHAEGINLKIGEKIAALPPMTSGTSDALIHHAAPYYAATIVIESRFDPLETCRFLVDEGVQVATAVPTMLARMMSNGGIDLLKKAPLRCFATYAASISFELANSVEERGNCKIVRCYGTMDFGGISMSTLDDDKTTRIRTVGKPFKDNEVKIVDDDGKELPVGETGQIIMRPSRLVMGTGYYRDLPKTLESWNDEFYRLGDLGMIDQSGNLSLVGRASELIIRAGQNINPSEIEELMISHPKVVDVSVVGLPDSELGEKVCACVLLKNYQTLKVDEIIEYFELLGVAKFKCPERIVSFEKFPMTMSGMKTDKRRLVEMLHAS